jgi:hypothetical protein
MVGRLRNEFALLGFPPLHLEKGDVYDAELKTAARVQAGWKVS